MNDLIGKGLLRNKTDTGLLAEWQHWEDKINSAKGWGASITAADEFRRDCRREIERRGLKIPRLNIPKEPV